VRATLNVLLFGTSRRVAGKQTAAYDGAMDISQEIHDRFGAKSEDWYPTVCRDLSIGTVELGEYRLHGPTIFRLDGLKSRLEIVMSDAFTFLKVCAPEEGASYARGRTALFSRGFIFEVDGTSLGPMTVPALRCTFRDPSSDRMLSREEIGDALDVRSPAVSHALERLAMELRSPGFHSGLLADSLLNTATIELGRYLRDSRSRQSARLTAQQMERVHRLIDAQSPLPTAAALAAECRVSRRHFFRLFRETTGMSLARYMMERRIARGRAMLSHDDLPTKQIAHLCGFPSVSAFNKAFRQIMGRTPRVFRQRVISWRTVAGDPPGRSLTVR